MPDDGSIADDDATSEAETVELAYEALAKDSPRVSAANMARDDADKAGAVAFERKVLNTERYNNGARAPLMAGGGRGARSMRGVRGARSLRRATVRALLACSGLLYAVAFLAFYFLSLP